VAISKRAAEVIAAPNRFAALQPAVPAAPGSAVPAAPGSAVAASPKPALPATPEDMAARIVVSPAGRVLPASFLDGSLWPAGSPGAPLCLRPALPKCVVRFVALRPGETEAILFFDQPQTSLYEQDAQGTWRKTAVVTGLTTCPAVRQGLEQDDVDVEPHAWPDLVVGGQRLILTPLFVPCAPAHQ
jgi:hypothetical protein